MEQLWIYFIYFIYYVLCFIVKEKRNHEVKCSNICVEYKMILK